MTTWSSQTRLKEQDSESKRSISIHQRQTVFLLRMVCEISSFLTKLTACSQEECLVKEAFGEIWQNDKLLE